MRVWRGARHRVGALNRVNGLLSRADAEAVNPNTRARTLQRRCRRAYNLPLLSYIARGEGVLKEIVHRGETGVKPLLMRPEGVRRAICGEQLNFVARFLERCSKVCGLGERGSFIVRAVQQRNGGPAWTARFRRAI